MAFRVIDIQATPNPNALKFILDGSVSDQPVSFLRPDGLRNADTPLDVVVDHLVYMVERLGEDGVALGSDFDGALIAASMGSVSGLPALTAAMRRRGFGDGLIEKICHRNWLGVLERTWGA